MLLILKLGLLAMATKLKSNIKIKWIGPVAILLRDQTIISFYITFMGVLKHYTSRNYLFYTTLIH